MGRETRPKQKAKECMAVDRKQESNVEQSDGNKKEEEGRGRKMRRKEKRMKRERE
jgi:hypothetical protein